MKQKTCKSCKRKFQPFMPFQTVCDPRCAGDWARMQTEKKRQKEHAQQKRDFYDNDKPFRAKAAQKAFNAFIRARDQGQPCISCQRYHSGQYHAGHYKTAGGNPELRFNELNCHLQCAPCNNHLSGNIVEYRKNLIEKIGADKADFLEGPHELKKYTAQDYKEIETYYKAKLKELEG